MLRSGQSSLGGRRSTLPRPSPVGVDYRPLHDFQSHEPEFDYLKSLEIEEKINKVKFAKRQNGSLMVLSTNGRFAPAARVLFRIGIVAFRFAFGIGMSH